MSVAIKEIDEGLFKLTISEPQEEITGRVNCYLVEGFGRKYFLIDSGWASSSRGLVRFIANEFRGIEIERLLLTHLHPDHFGGSKAIIGRYSSKMSFHHRETLHLAYYDLFRKNLTQSANVLGAPAGIIESARDRIRASRAALPEPESYLRDGTTIKGRSGTWRIVHTPGHTPGHVCFYRQKDRTLISGDHILAEETPNIAFYPVPRYNSLRSYFASLAKVKRLEPRFVLPGHGDTFDNLAARVEALRAHHRQRLHEVFRELRRNPRFVAEVASSVKWSRGKFQSLGRFDKWLAILETISHLEFLVECGVAQKEKGSGRSYKLAGRDWSLVEKSMANLLAK